jgi:hypothetical protein
VLLQQALRMTSLDAIDEGSSSAEADAETT